MILAIEIQMIKKNIDEINSYGEQILDLTTKEILRLRK